MDSTTLITFHYKTQPDVRSVELFGSWDNFSRPYIMQRDVHKGRGSWTGCHSFENIICDGERFDATKPRNGALKQGGTYWYFYKLNDEEESCDPTQLTTTTCPLLPGQLVNTLDIPVELTEPPKRVSSASDSIPSMLNTHMTTDPADRYKKIYRKHPTKLPRYYCSSDALRERFYADGNKFVRGEEAPRLRNRDMSPESRSTKRVRWEAPSPQTPGARQIDVTPEDMAILSQIAGQQQAEQEEEDMPVLKPFGPCFGSPTSEDERPVTRGGFMDFRKGLGFSFFSSNRKSMKKTHRLSDQSTMDYEYTSPQVPQHDGSADRPQTASTKSPSKSILSKETRTQASTEEGWPLPRFNPLRSNPISSVKKTIVPTLDLESQLSNPDPEPFQYHYPSPAPTASSPSDSDSEYHPGFGPAASNHNSIHGTGLFDMISPTFTVETLASSPGISTPDRNNFSFQAPQQDFSASSSLSFYEQEPKSLSREMDLKSGLEDLSRRLSALTSASEHEDTSDYDSDSDTSSLFQAVKKTTEFYAFCPTIGSGLKDGNSNDSNNKKQKYLNESSATLKPGSKQLERLEVRGIEDTGVFRLDLESDEEGRFSEDVFGALGIEI